MRLALGLACVFVCSCREEPPIAAPIDPAIEEAEAAEREVARAAAEPQRPAPAVEGGARFLTRRQLRFDDKPQWVTGSDLDGDGRDDLVVATLAPGRLHVFQNVGGALPREPVSLAIAGYPLRPRPFELDGGARRGLLVVTRADGRVTLWDPFGEQPVRPRFEHELEATPRAFACGDLAADGSREIVVIGDRGRLDVLAAEPADGEARTVQSATVANELPRCLYVPTDGRTVVIGYQASRRLRAHPVDATGRVGATAVEAELGGIPRALTEADVDGDGDRELVVAGGDDAVWVFGHAVPGDSTRWFDVEPLVWRAAAIPIDVALHADGLDVLSYGGLGIAAWSDFEANGPARRFEAYAGQTPRSATAFDVDGDGRRDVAIANPDSHAVSLFRGAPDGTLEAERRTPVGEFPDDVSLGDVDADGDLDVLTCDSNDGTLSLCPNERGTLGERRTIPVGAGPRATRFVDLDGDGHLDVALLVQRDVGASCARLFGDGRGGFARRPEAPDAALGPAARDLCVADLDLDGVLELVVVDDESGRVRVLSGAPDAELRTILNEPVGSRPSAVVAVEADADARPELAFALAGSGAAEDRRGVLVAEVRDATLHELAFVELPHGPFDLVTADLDGDRVAELVALAALGPDGSPGEVVPILLRREAPGSACALVALAARPTDLAPRQIAAADVDGDHRAELVCCTQFSHVVDLWSARGRGLGLVLEREPDLGAGIGPMAAAFGDVDGDGHPDLVVANGHSGDVSVLRVRSGDSR